MSAADSEPRTGRKSYSLRVSSRFGSRLFRRISAGALRRPSLTADREGAELLEFALALPLILVMVAGLLDFANAYHVKQILANAARAGARLGSVSYTQDLNSATPISINPIKEDVTSYLHEAGVNTSFIGKTMTYDTTTETATYYSKGSYGLKIERWVQIPDADGTGMPLPATRVTLTYPYDWTFGFNHIIKLLIPSANSLSTIDITTDAMMANQ